MGTGFGTGSAAPHRGDRSIKDITALFSNNHSSLHMGGFSTEEQQALAEVATQVRLCFVRQFGKQCTAIVGALQHNRTTTAVWLQHAKQSPFAELCRHHLCCRLLFFVAIQAGMSAGRVDSTGDGGLRSWVSSMSAVWRNLGVGSAKGPLEGGPSTQEIKDNIKWDVSNTWYQPSWQLSRLCISYRIV